MAENIAEDVNANAILIPKIEDIMDSTMTNNAEATNYVDATPILKEMPLFCVGSFEASADLTKLLNDVVSKKPIIKLNRVSTLCISQKDLSHGTSTNS